jgi:hypothetical protein
LAQCTQVHLVHRLQHHQDEVAEEHPHLENGRQAPSCYPIERYEPNEEYSEDELKIAEEKADACWKKAPKGQRAQEPKPEDVCEETARA